ncbi:hypothetical protein EAH89_28200 [Roseomonas nepalensis]|uniref:Uncharacterized protein n=1 Tax=Muricoccus nepalensis TaxID=1854500 RepID=A0A502F0H4_9PROT|nr:hypothetical protein [Roseomonas nepalensis]TPG41931.1 hypothetical protein EAH89_28200 [Roseomonas nepalensis]
MSQRRTLALGGLAAFGLPAVAGSAAAAPGPDAALIAWCARWAEAEAGYSAVTEPYGRTLDEPPPEVEAAAEAFSREALDMLERIQATPARTGAGFRAKARVALRRNLDVGDEVAEALAWGLLRDLLTGDPYLAAMDRVKAARTALAARARISRRGDPAYDRLDAEARRAEAKLARVGRAAA